MTSNDIIKSFCNFVGYCWYHLQLPPPTPVQYEIAEYLQYGPDRRILLGFRGIAKTWLTAAYTVFSLNRDPEEKVVVASGTKSYADNISTFMQQLITTLPLLKDLRPSAHQRSSKMAFDVGPTRPAPAPSVKSVGIFGQTTGSRASLCIGDDCETLVNSSTEDAREDLLRAIREFEAIIVPGGHIIILGTYQTEESVYIKLADEFGYDCRKWPSEYPPYAELNNVKHQYLAPNLRSQLVCTPELAGTPTDPKRFDTNTLIQKRSGFGIADYTLQFLLDPSLSDAAKYPLKLSDLIAFDIKPKVPAQYTHAKVKDLRLDIRNIGFTGDGAYRPWSFSENFVPLENITVHVDPSGTGEDEIGYAAGGTAAGYVYLLESGGLQGGYSEENFQKLLCICKMWKAKLIRFEDNFGDGMFTQLFTSFLSNERLKARKAGKATDATFAEISVEGFKVNNTQKERRNIAALEPVMNQHRLVVNASVLQTDVDALALEPKCFKYLLTYQLTHVSTVRGCLKHDDRLDALAAMVAYYQPAVVQVPEEVAEANTAAEIAAGLESLGQFIGMSSHAGTLQLPQPSPGNRGAGAPKKLIT